MTFASQIKDVNLADADRIESVSKHPVSRYGINPTDSAASHYNDLIAKVRHYSKEHNIDAMHTTLKMYTDIFDVMSKERDHRESLQVLALETILNMDEFVFVRGLIESGDLKIDAKLVDADGLDINTDMDDLPETEEDPEARFSLVEVMFDDDERKFRKVLANSIAQGSGLNAQYAFHLLEDELNQIAEGIVDTYGFIMSFSTLLYYAMPTDMNPIGAQQAGQAEVSEDEEGTYVIKARGLIFPVLLQEIVKGIYQYVSLTDGLRNAEEGDVADEINDIIVGPKVSDMFRKHIKPEDSKYIIPAFQRMLIELDADEIKEIFTATDSNNPLVDIINTIKEEEESHDEISFDS
jgi:hypothetical protein